VRAALLVDVDDAPVVSGGNEVDDDMQLGMGKLGVWSGWSLASCRRGEGRLELLRAEVVFER
jgi:hypothetical protein